MKSVLIIFLLLPISWSYSQDLKKEFEMMNEHLFELQNYRLNVSYSAGNAEKIEEEGLVSVFVDSNGMFYQIGNTSIIINESKTIMVDDEEKMIMHSNNEKVKRKSSIRVTDYMIQGIDTLIETSDNITFYEKQGKRTYNLRFKKSYFDLVQIEFSDGFLSKVNYYYNSEIVEEEGVTATCIVELEENIKFDVAHMYTQFYLSETEDGIRPSENFNNYLIIYNESLESFID